MARVGTRWDDPPARAVTNKRALRALAPIDYGPSLSWMSIHQCWCRVPRPRTRHGADRASPITSPRRIRACARERTWDRDTRGCDARALRGSHDRRVHRPAARDRHPRTRRRYAVTRLASFGTPVIDGSLSDLAIDRLSNEVGMAIMTCIFFDHVHDHPAQAG